MEFYWNYSEMRMVNIYSQYSFSYSFAIPWQRGKIKTNLLTQTNYCYAYKFSFVLGLLFDSLMFISWKSKGSNRFFKCLTCIQLFISFHIIKCCQNRLSKRSLQIHTLSQLLEILHRYCYLHVLLKIHFCKCIYV